MDEERMPEALERVVRRLHEERPQMRAPELDSQKTRILNRAESPMTKGTFMKGRAALAVLTMALMGAGAGGVVAASGGSAGGASSAQSQYVHCGKGTHRVGNHCVSNGNPHGCGKGTHWNPKTRQCVANPQPPKCGKGTHPKNGQCVANKPKPKHFCGKGTHFDKKSNKCVADKPKPHHTTRHGIRQASRPSHSRRGFTG
jgi:hypothetical protein